MKSRFYLLGRILFWGTVGGTGFAFSACQPPLPSEPAILPSVSASSTTAFSLKLELKPIGQTIYELRWQAWPEAESYQIWLDGTKLKEVSGQTFEYLSLTYSAQGLHQVRVECRNAAGRLLGQETLPFQLEHTEQFFSPQPTATLPSPSSSPTELYPNAYTYTPPPPSPSPSATPQVVYVYATPLPIYTSDVEGPEKTVFDGHVFDDHQEPLANVLIQARSLNSSVPFYQEMLTNAEGVYSNHNAPLGVQIEITASKAGYCTRKRLGVLKSNNRDAPNVNRYDFGNDGRITGFSPSYNALSDKPEVVMVTPTRNGSGVEPTTGFILKFSEPMDTQSVEDTFTVRSFNSRKLTVDAGSATRTHTVTGNGAVATNFLAGNSTPIWDKEAFNIRWNSEDTEVTFTFKDEKRLPSDKDSNLVPDYNVAFRSFSGGDRVLKDKSGISRTEKHFKLTDGDFEESFKFAIRTDEDPPALFSLKQEAPLQQRKGLILSYREPMRIATLGRMIGGGMADTPASCLQAPAGFPDAQLCTVRQVATNYSAQIYDPWGKIRYQGTWADLGGEVEFWNADPTYRSVSLTLSPYTGPALSGVYFLGQENLCAPGTYHSGPQADLYRLELIARGGQKTPLEIVLPGSLFNNSAFVQALQTALNAQVQTLAQPPSVNAFQVRTLRTEGSGSPDINGQIGIRFLDTSGHYLGFAFAVAPAGNDASDHLPDFQPGGNDWLPGNPLPVLPVGGRLELSVRATVTDPAGNPIAPAYRSQQLTLY